MSDLTPREREFMANILLHGGFATRRQVGCCVYRDEDRVRQSCRRRGFVEHQGSAHGRKKSGWALTDAGRLVLSGADHDG